MSTAPSIAVPSATSVPFGDRPLQLGTNPSILLETWIALYAISQALLVLLICTLFLQERNARSENGHGGRHATLINMLFTMLLNTIVCSLLYYKGEQANPSPPYELCLVQATLKHGSGPMIATSEFCLALHLFLSTRARIRFLGDANLWIVRSLLICPYVMGFAWAIPVLLMGLKNPELIHRLPNAYYCTYSSPLLGDISTIFVVILILSTAGLLAHALRQVWAPTRKFNSSRSLDTFLLVRLSVYVFLQVVYTVVTIIELIFKATSVADHAIVYLSSILEVLYPIAYFILLGLRQDTIAIWLGWIASLLPPALASFLAVERDGTSVSMSGSRTQLSTIISIPSINEGCA